MKQIILSLFVVLTLLSATLPTYADNSTNRVEAVSPTANQLVEKFGNRLDSLITTLATKAGVATEHFYPIFITQQRIEGISNLCLMIIGIFIAVSLLIFGFKNASIHTSSEYNSKEEHNAEPRMIFGFVAGIIFSIIVSIAIMAGFTETIGQISNPEYHAIQSLVQMVK